MIKDRISINRIIVNKQDIFIQKNVFDRIKLKSFSKLDYIKLIEAVVLCGYMLEEKDDILPEFTKLTKEEKKVKHYCEDLITEWDNLGLIKIKKKKNDKERTDRR